MDKALLLITAGDGPMECRLAVGHILARLRVEAEALGVDVSCSTEDKAPASAMIALEGGGSRLLATAWIGTVQWRQASQLRPGNRRANWFVGVFDLPLPAPTVKGIPLAEVQFSSFRAGGPGGQHQNTTDSAVRAVGAVTQRCHAMAVHSIKTRPKRWSVCKRWCRQPRPSNSPDQEPVHMPGTGN